MLMANKPVTGQDGLYASATFDQNSHEIILKLINSKSEPQSVKIILEGAKKLLKKAKMISLQSNDLTTFNSLEHPTVLVPVENELIFKGKTFEKVLAGYSFTVIKVKQE